jgi:glycerol-3-phosphate O-acyltransferase
LLGESPKPDNAIKILRYFFAINKPLGKVIIRYCEPISLDSYLEQHSKKSGLALTNYVKDEKATKSLIHDLGEELSYIQADNLVVMSTSMIATILLMHRKGISMDMLIKRVVWVYEELKARKADVGLTTPPSS